MTDSNETRVRRVLQQDFHFVTSHFHSGIFQDEDKNYKMSLLTQQEGLWRDCVKFHLVTLSRFLDTVNNMKFIQEEVQLIKKNNYKDAVSVAALTGEQLPWRLTRNQ